jgi:hypothetical protein
MAFISRAAASARPKREADDAESLANFQSRLRNYRAQAGCSLLILLLDRCLLIAGITSREPANGERDCHKRVREGLKQMVLCASGASFARAYGYTGPLHSAVRGHRRGEKHGLDS